MIPRHLLSKVPRVVRSVRGAGFISTTSMCQDPETVAEKQVPVVTYAADDGHSTPKDGLQTVLTVDKSKPSPSTSPIMDVAKHAFALEEHVASQLTGTLKKFTLHGKVAVITGYVLLILSFCNSISLYYI